MCKVHEIKWIPENWMVNFILAGYGKLKYITLYCFGYQIHNIEQVCLLTDFCCHFNSINLNIEKQLQSMIHSFCSKYQDQPLYKFFQPSLYNS